jgi:Tol biopolymer transport system component
MCVVSRRQNVSRFLALALVATSAACSGDRPGALEPTTTPLEDVSYDAIGPGTIMFERSLAGTALYVVDGTARTSQIAFSDVTMRGARLSPDGDRVVFANFDFDFDTFEPDIYVVPLDGGVRVNITHSSAFEGLPSWSSTGSHVLFPTALQPTTFVRQSPVANPSDRMEIARFTFESGQPIVCPNAAYATPGALSASGDLAFPCARSIYRRVAGTDTETLPVYTASASATVHAPAWSSDGSQLAFVELNGGSLSVTRMDADGSNPTTLATVPTASTNWALFNIYSLCWSAGDTRIFFSVPESAHVAHIWLVRSDGTGLQRITTRDAVFDHNVSCAG